MTDYMPEINNFIVSSLAYLNSFFKKGMRENETDLSEVYPYIYTRFDVSSVMDVNENMFDYLGILYESLVPDDVRKDIGQFYTREDAVIETMLNSVDVLSGKILEPSCGSGVFVVKIIEKIILKLKSHNFTAEEILDYICNYIYANDIDCNAVGITEINILAKLIPLIITAKKQNPNYVMKPLQITQIDFTKKNVFEKDYALVIGNPPFVTMYGKRSRNMTEQKRMYFNTFDFVQNKKGNNKFNISMFFIENGLKLLNEEGHLCFILDISFFETAFTDMRKYIVENYYIDSFIIGLQEFKDVASGQLILNIINRKKSNPSVKIIDYNTGKTETADQLMWNDPKNNYKFNAPLNKIQQSINLKIFKYNNLEEYFPGKALRTCCALTGKTEEFIVDPSIESECMIFPYIEGSKGLRGKFFSPTPERYIKYDYDLQLKLSNEFKEKLEKQGVKNKKRVTLGDKEAYLAPKIFIRQSAKEIIATYSNKPYAANNSIYILTTKENSVESVNMLKYTCGLLNSDLITFFCRINKIIRADKGRTPQIKISDLKNIRIKMDNNYYVSIIELVDKLLINPQDIGSYQRLNELVFDLYGINEKEKLFIKNYLMTCL